MTGEIGSRVRVSTLTGTGYYEGRLGSVIRTPAGIDAVVLEVDDADHMPARVTVRWAAVEALSVLAPPDDEEGPS